MTQPERPDQTSSTPSQAQAQASAWGLASNFTAGVLGMGFIGWALERWVWPGAAPWLLLGGIAMGLFGGGYRFVRDAIRMNNS